MLEEKGLRDRAALDNGLIALACMVEHSNLIMNGKNPEMPRDFVELIIVAYSDFVAFPSYLSIKHVLSDNYFPSIK